MKRSQEEGGWLKLALGGEGATGVRGQKGRRGLEIMEGVERRDNEGGGDNSQGMVKG